MWAARCRATIQAPLDRNGTRPRPSQRPSSTTLYMCSALMLLASTPARARAALFHGLQLVTASRIAVFFGEPFQNWDDRGNRLPSERGRACRANPGDVPFFSRGDQVVLRAPGKQRRAFSRHLKKGNPAGSRRTARRPDCAVEGAADKNNYPIFHPCIAKNRHAERRNHATCRSPLRDASPPWCTMRAAGMYATVDSRPARRLRS